MLFIDPVGVIICNMKYKYIFFDLDGTLIDSYAALFATVLDTLQEHNLPLIPENEGMIGLKNVYKKHAHIVDPKKLRETHLEMQKNHFHKNTLFPQVKATLTFLKNKGIPLALVTTGNKPKVQHLLNVLAIDNLFDVVVTESDVQNLKPHTEPFEKASQLLGITQDRKNEILMVGDTEVDILGAQNFGIDVVAVTYSVYGQKVKDYKPTYMIDRFQDLLPIIGV
jgi:pyrophosphatase PpaX